MNLIKKQKIAIFFTFFLSVNVFAMETVIRYEGTGKMGPWIAFSKGYYDCTKFTDSGKYDCHTTKFGNQEMIPNCWFYILAREYVEQEKRKKEKISAEEAIDEATTGNISDITTAGIAAAQNKKQIYGNKRSERLWITDSKRHLGEDVLSDVLFL